MTFPSTAAKFAFLLFALFMAFAMTSNAYAEPKRANGGACDSTGTARKDGKDQDGNKMNCQWDTCTYTECSTSGGSISNCVQKTEYSNPTDCHPAATVHSGLGLTQLGNLGVQQQFTDGGQGANPVKPPRGMLVSLQAAVSTDELRDACKSAGGLFSAGNALYQCVAVNGDVLSCRTSTHYCTGSLVVHKRPPTLLGFATAPFGKGAGYLPPAEAADDHGPHGSSSTPPDDTPPPVIY